jgi:ribosomal protein S1
MQGRYHYGELILRKTKILGNMLGAEIDFIVKGIDSKSRSVVASRKDAMIKKRQTFYMDADINGKYKVYEGRIIQARIIAVSEKVVRVDAFGVEYSIPASDLSWDWLGDAQDHYHIGDAILVKVTEVNRESIDKITIKAEAKSINGVSEGDNLKKCRVQGKYAGRVTDIRKGVVFARLNIGVNAVAHSCLDNKMPGKKDDVSFAITHIDEDKKVAVGIITRIIKRNL